jgi:serine/threonine protein phosphatase PrpC
MPVSGLAILADGMGGYNAGEVASRMATTLLASRLEAAFATTAAHETDRMTGQPFARRSLAEQIEAVKCGDLCRVGESVELGGMGTTLVATVFCDDKVIVAHVGDSRLYRLRGEEFMAMTHDHSVLQEQIDQGLMSAKEARYSLNRNLVTRAVGVDPDKVEAEIHVYRYGRAMSICCVRMVSTTWSMRRKFSRPGNVRRQSRSFRDATDQMANDNGGDDNISVVVVKVLREFPVARGGWSKLWSWLN